MRVSSSSWNRKEPESVSILYKCRFQLSCRCLLFIKKEMKLYNISQWTQRGVWIRVCCIIIRFWWWSIMIKALSFRLKQLPSLHPRGAKHWSPTWKWSTASSFRCSFLCLFEYFNGLWAWKPSKEIRKFIGAITIGSWLFLIKMI
jgi:hypothetical protein